MDRRSPKVRVAAVGLVVVLLALSAALSLPARPAAAAPTLGQSDSAIGTLFGDVISGASEGTVSSLVGWGLSAIGQNSAEDAAFSQISSELATISNELTDIDAELQQIETVLQQQTCDLETAQSTLSARTSIDSLITTYNEYLAAGATETQLKAFVADIVYGTSNGGVSLQSELVSINDALLNAGTAQGVIAACAAAVGAPTSGTLSDTAYYAQLTNLMMFFYGYQTKGALLLTEAYHYLAYESWASSGSSSSITPSDVSSICVGAVGDVAVYCGQAAYMVQVIYDNLQDEFALSGAPYSVSGETAMLNGSTYLFTLSLEDYTDTVDPSNTCTKPLTSAAPCGPTSGTNLQTFSGQTYAGRSDWSPATAPMLRTLLGNWKTSSQNAGTFLDDLGFSNMDNKILLTPTTYTATPSCGGCQPSGTIFSLTAACFVDTSVELSHAQQPFCYNGETTDGLTYGSANELLENGGYWDHGNCLSFSSSSWLPSGATANYFYTGTYNSALGASSCSAYWVNGTSLGWISAYGYTEVQLLLPALDTSTTTCGTNVDGTVRTNTNAGGVPTMCGSDFDTWFANIVPSPYASTSATVSIDDDRFSPRNVTITAGSEVTWSHHGADRHSVTADDGSFDSSPACPTSGCLEHGGTFTHRFTEPGTYRYHCRLHGAAGGAGMSGTVRVLGVSEARAPTAAPAVAPATPIVATPIFTG